MFAEDCLDITGPDNWSGTVSFVIPEEINSGLARLKEWLGSACFSERPDEGFVELQEENFDEWPYEEDLEESPGEEGFGKCPEDRGFNKWFDGMCFTEQSRFEDSDE